MEKPSSLKYAAGTYADVAMSIPIWVGEKLATGLEKVLSNNTPQFSKWEHIKERSEIYRTRETLREKLDTRPGALYIQSNVLSTLPAFAVGMPAAECAQDLINYAMPNAPEIVNCVTNSLATIATQVTVGYSIFMANEVRTNPSKYRNENNQISPRKVGTGLKNAAKMFLKFDLTYTGIKTAFQSSFLLMKKNPWAASCIADSIALPLWFTIAIPMGLNGGIIETKFNSKDDSQIPLIPNSEYVSNSR